ncbi:MAG: MFS transporter, partial [Chloroflexi bacterium]|nr:MFS transporter [Chloroflexota bacterium]
MFSSDGVFGPAHRSISIGILLAITAIACEGMAVATVLPSVALDLGGLDNYGWAFSAFMLASLVGAISAGESADRHNGLLPARLGFACFSVGLVVSGLAPLWPILLIGRLVQGFGAGCLLAVSFVAIARAYAEALRPRMMALISSAWIV